MTISGASAGEMAAKEARHGVRSGELREAPSRDLGLPRRSVDWAERKMEAPNTTQGELIKVQVSKPKNTSLKEIKLQKQLHSINVNLELIYKEAQNQQ